MGRLVGESVVIKVAAPTLTSVGVNLFATMIVAVAVVAATAARVAVVSCSRTSHERDLLQSNRLELDRV